jgi:LAO/AO transport system kinase
MATANRSIDKARIAADLNRVEDRRPASRPDIDRLLDRLEGQVADAHVVGITGPPGVGKSTLTSALINLWRARGTTVGVVAVDPSSKRSGGALLADRVRISVDANDNGVFIRSMAAGDQLGGLARATQAAVVVLAASFDMVLVETVGVGQSETDIEDLADTVVFVVQPGSGDALQFMKSGIMEIPDILVVNKADEEKLARQAGRDLLGSLGYRETDPGGWIPCVARTCALDGTGVGELAGFLDAHKRHLDEKGLAAMRAEKGRRWALTAYGRWAGERGIEKAGGIEPLRSFLANEPPASARACLARLIRAFPP